MDWVIGTYVMYGTNLLQIPLLVHTNRPHGVSKLSLHLSCNLKLMKSCVLPGLSENRQQFPQQVHLWSN